MILRKAGIAIIVVLASSILQAGNYDANSLRPVLEILGDASLSGSLEFSGHCDPRRFPDFPRFGSSKDEATDALGRLRMGFAEDAELQVVRDPSGIVRMVEKGVPSEILKVRIARITFDNQGGQSIYSPNGALGIIVRSPEIEAFVQAHQIRFLYSSSAVIGSTSSPIRDAPHVSGVLENVTLSEALDYVLKTFPGLWIYENCPDASGPGRRVYFRFYFLRRVGSKAFVVE